MPSSTVATAWPGPDGQVVFVRHALPGERVRAVVTEDRKGFLRADAVEVLAASAAPGRAAVPVRRPGPLRRVRPAARAPAYQRELKAAVVREQLTRLAGCPDEVERSTSRRLPLPGSRRSGLADPGAVHSGLTGRAGLLKHRSHEVVPVDGASSRTRWSRSAPVLDAGLARPGRRRGGGGGRGEVSLLGTARAGSAHSW